MTDIRDKFWLEVKRTALLVIDVQEKLVPAINKNLYQHLLQNVPLLIEGCRSLGLPVIVTEQYPKGLGHTIPEFSEAAREHCIEKLSFSCCGDDGFVAALKKTGADQVIIVGMETHVCVLQTVLDLLDRGYGVHLVRDAVGSRFIGDYENALNLAAAAGAVITTTETALFQLIKIAGTDEFKVISKLVRRRTE